MCAVNGIVCRNARQFTGEEPCHIPEEQGEVSLAIGTAFE